MEVVFMGKGRLIGFILGSIPVFVMVVFIGIPIVMAVLYTLGDVGGPNSVVSAMAQHQVVAKHGLTLRLYQQLFQDPSFRKDLWATVWVTVLSVLVVLVLSWILALYVRFSHGTLSKIVSTIYLIPMFIPVVIASYALVTFWNDGGFVTALAEHLGTHFPGIGYTLAGVVVAQVWVNLPFSVLMLSSGLQGVPDSVIEAARDVGASWLPLVLRIIMPLNILPTVIVGTFVAIGVLGSFTIPYMVGPTSPQMLGVAMASYYQSYNEPQQSEAMAMILFILALAIGFVYVWANIRADKKEGVLR
jgi:ABC-type spermidine/putrescine transport system permease subunit I